MISSSTWHKRWHPLRETWVVYAGHRNSRPWTVGKQDAKPNLAPSFDPDCYLCPGNHRVGGHQNPDYKEVFVFDNDHPVGGPNAPDVPETHSFYHKASAKGLARVICYDPHHNVSMA